MTEDDALTDVEMVDIATELTKQLIDCVDNEADTDEHYTMGLCRALEVIIEELFYDHEEDEVEKLLPNLMASAKLDARQREAMLEAEHATKH